jgi:hypothetical protein
MNLQLRYETMKRRIGGVRNQPIKMMEVKPLKR